MIYARFLYHYGITILSLDVGLPLLPDLPGRRLERLGQYPRRQLTCVDGQRNRAPGDFFLRQ